MNDFNDYLQHHGIKGMKWGIRRFRNTDGTLTPEGRKRYGYDYRRPYKEKGFDEKTWRRLANAGGNLVTTHNAYLKARSGSKWNNIIADRKVLKSFDRNGDITEYGKKRYGHSEEGYRELYGRIHEEMGGRKGSSTGPKAIGKHSRKVIEDAKQAEKAFKNSKEYKEYSKKRDKAMDKAYKRFESGKITEDDLSDIYEYWAKAAPKPNKAMHKGSKGYYQSGVGKDLNIAYLQDIGFNEKNAKEIASGLSKNNRGFD
jgi:hypothetical protein